MGALSHIRLGICTNTVVHYNLVCECMQGQCDDRVMCVECDGIKWNALQESVLPNWHRDVCIRESGIRSRQK